MLYIGYFVILAICWSDQIFHDNRNDEENTIVLIIIKILMVTKCFHIVRQMYRNVFSERWTNVHEK